MIEKGSTPNRYDRWIAEDNDLCLPVISSSMIQGILREVAMRVHVGLGSGPEPRSTLDLEQLQIADYSKFDGVSDTQRGHISKFHRENPIRPEEMILLALRSLIQFTWPMPEQESDLVYAASYELILNQVLARRSLEIASDFVSPEALQAYWGRLAFLRVMRDIPEENLKRFGLDRVAVALVRKAKFNAATWAFDNGPMITMNYALEPILKHLNRFLLHFHSTSDMVGPRRMERAWNGIVPVVQHFWSDVSAVRLINPSLMLYGEGRAIMLHRLTADQIDFIVSHEIGHVALDHPRRLVAAKAAASAVTALRHEFEFGADVFALGLARSRLLKSVRSRTDQAEGEQRDEAMDQVVFALHEHQKGLGAVYLLFTYMEFIRRAGELVRRRIGERSHFRELMDTHPGASDRLMRLELANLGENLYTSPLQRYANVFLGEILEYANSLSDDALLNSLG